MEEGLSPVPGMCTASQIENNRSPSWMQISANAETLLQQTNECDKILGRLGEITAQLTSNLGSSAHLVSISTHAKKSYRYRQEQKFEINVPMANVDFRPTSSPNLYEDSNDQRIHANFSHPSRTEHLDIRVEKDTRANNNLHLALMEALMWARTISLDVSVELENLQRVVAHLKDELKKCKALLVDLASASAYLGSTAVRVGGGFVYASGDPWQRLQAFVSNRDGLFRSQQNPDRSQHGLPVLHEHLSPAADGAAHSRITKRAARFRKMPAVQASVTTQESGQDPSLTITSISERLRDQRDDIDRALNEHDEAQKAWSRTEYDRSMDFLALNRECNRLQHQKVKLESKLRSLLADRTKAALRSFLKLSFRSWRRVGKISNALSLVKRSLKEANHSNWRNSYLVWAFGRWASATRASHRMGLNGRVCQNQWRRGSVALHFRLWKAAVGCALLLRASAGQRAPQRRFAQWTWWWRRRRHCRWCLDTVAKRRARAMCGAALDRLRRAVSARPLQKRCGEAKRWMQAVTTRKPTLQSTCEKWREKANERKRKQHIISRAIRHKRWRARARAFGAWAEAREAGKAERGKMRAAVVRLLAGRAGGAMSRWAEVVGGERAGRAERACCAGWMERGWSTGARVMRRAVRGWREARGRREERRERIKTAEGRVRAGRARRELGRVATVVAKWRDWATETRMAARGLEERRERRAMAVATALWREGAEGGRDALRGWRRAQRMRRWLGAWRGRWEDARHGRRCVERVAGRRRRRLAWWGLDGLRGGVAEGGAGREAMCGVLLRMGLSLTAPVCMGKWRRVAAERRSMRQTAGKAAGRQRLRARARAFGAWAEAREAGKAERGKMRAAVVRLLAGRAGGAMSRWAEVVGGERAGRAERACCAGWMERGWSTGARVMRRAVRGWREARGRSEDMWECFKLVAYRRRRFVCKFFLFFHFWRDLSCRRFSNLHLCIKVRFWTLRTQALNVWKQISVISSSRCISPNFSKSRFWIGTFLFLRGSSITICCIFARKWQRFTALRKIFMTKYRLALFSLLRRFRISVLAGWRIVCKTSRSNRAKLKSVQIRSATSKLHKFLDWWACIALFKPVSLVCFSQSCCEPVAADIIKYDKSLPVVACDDIVRYFETRLDILLNCLDQCKEKASRRLHQLSVPTFAPDSRKSHLDSIKLQIKNRSQMCPDMQQDLQDQIMNLTHEREEFLKAISRLEGEATFANESQKSAWIAVQQMSFSLQLLQEKYSTNLEKHRCLQQQFTEIAAHVFSVESALKSLEHLAEHLSSISTAAQLQFEKQVWLSNSQNYALIKALKHENIKLHAECVEIQAAFQISDAQHVMANNEIRRVLQELKAAEDRCFNLREQLACHERSRALGDARDLRIAMFLEHMERTFYCQCEQLDNLMVAARIAFDHDYQMTKAIAMDAVKLGRAIYLELCAAQTEQTLLNKELSICRQHLISVAKVTAKIGRKSTRVGGGYYFVGMEFLDLHRYAASSWWGKEAGLDPRLFHADDDANSGHYGRQPYISHSSLISNERGTVKNPQQQKLPTNQSLKTGVTPKEADLPVESKSSPSVLDIISQHSHPSLSAFDATVTQTWTIPVHASHNENSSDGQEREELEGTAAHTQEAFNSKDFGLKLVCIEQRLRGLIDAAQ